MNARTQEKPTLVVSGRSRKTAPGVVEHVIETPTGHYIRRIDFRRGRLVAFVAVAVAVALGWWTVIAWLGTRVLPWL